MRLYHDYCFAPLMDWLLSGEAINELRRRVVEPAAGRVLEIGFGTGLNLPFYRSDVTSLTLLDSERLLPARVKRRMDACRARHVVATQTTAERLPFEAGTFDSVVSTFTLCTIPDVAAALAEVRRVLKAGGRFLFAEHGRSDSRSRARWQDRLDPLQQWWACGCHLNRPIERLIGEADLAITRLDRPTLPGMPRLVMELYVGQATCPNSPTSSAI
jgi:SAM-dependent methyltransferase